MTAALLHDSTDQASLQTHLSTTDLDVVEIAPRRFSLSHHARLRLAERASIKEAALINLLDAGACVTIRRDYRRNIRSEAIPASWPDAQSRDGKPMYKHHVVWSEADNEPVVAIASAENGTVVTVLKPSLAKSDKLPSCLTSDVIEKAKVLASAAERGPLHWLEHEVHVAWIDQNDFVKRRRVKASAIPTLLNQSMSPQDCLREVAMDLGRGGREIWAVLRHRKHPSEIAFEVSLS